MTFTCDRCHGETAAIIELRNVSWSGGIVSKLVSRYEVCPTCHDHMKQNDDIDWSGK